MTNQETLSFSCGPSLAATYQPCDSLDPSDVGMRRSLTIVNVHRYEEQIAGRTYFIEVQPITDSRWRAQIARRPGMPTALMPFYGPTPEDAARELSRWLTLIYNGSNS